MDIRTAAVLLGLVNTLLALILVLQYRFSRGQPGLGWWALGQTCVALGMAVGNLRGSSFLGHLAIVFYQVILVAAPLLMYVGIKRFFGKPERRAPIVAVLVVIGTTATVFTFVTDNYVVRAALMLVAVAVGLAMAAAATIRDRTPDVRGPALFLGWVLGLAAAMYLLAGVRQAFESAPESIFHPSPLIAVTYVFEIVTTVLWTFGMILMLNQRLSAEVRNDATNLRTVFEAIPDSVVISRLRDGTVVDVNPGFSRISGYAQGDVIDGHLRAAELWAKPEDRERMISALQTDGVCEGLRGRLRRKDGSEVECVLNARVLTLGTEPHVVSVTRDITDELAIQEQLRREATTDALTGMANRRHFLTLAETAIAEARAQQGQVAIAMLDLDGLKTINDTFGHPDGDAAIAAFAAAITTSLPQVLPPQCSPEHCVPGRLGGDEFGLLLPGADAASGLDVVESLRHAIAHSPSTTDLGRMPLTFSAGVTDHTDAQDTVDTMLARADSAMYEAKHQGRNRGVLASPSAPPGGSGMAARPGEAHVTEVQR